MIYNDYKWIYKEFQWLQDDFQWLKKIYKQILDNLQWFTIIIRGFEMVNND